jgi:hypothetical protein
MDGELVREGGRVWNARKLWREGKRVRKMKNKPPSIHPGPPFLHTVFLSSFL